MKSKYLMTVGLFAGVLVLGSCNDKKQANNKPKTKTKNETDKSVFALTGKTAKPKPSKSTIPVKPTSEKSDTKTTPKEETLGPEIPANYVRTEETLKQGSIDDLAKKAGYAAFLPKNTDLLFSLQGVDKMLAKFMQSDLRKGIDLFAPEGHSIKLAMEENIDFQQFMNVVGEEVFFAAGNESAEFLKNLAECYSAAQNYSIRSSVKTMLLMTSGALEDEDGYHKLEELQAEGLQFYKSKDGLLKYLKKMNAAPLYAGFKVSDRVQRDKFLKMLIDGSQELVKKQPAGSKAFTTVRSNKGNGFTGVHINVKEAIALSDPMILGSFQQMLGDSYDLLMAEAVKKEFTFMIGSVGDYIVFYAGANVDGLEIATIPSQSVLANPEMKFATNYADKDISFLGYMSNEISVVFSEVQGGYGDLFKSLAKALEGTEDTLGDTSDFRALLNKFGAKEKALLALYKPTRYGMVGYFEDGYKLDTYMGATSAYHDLDSKRKLAAMANHEDAFISANWIANQKAGVAYLEYLESIVVLTYKGFKIATAFQSEERSWTEFTSTFRMFDTAFTDDLLRVWNGIKTGGSGLGSETAFMADLKGRLPRIPKVPSVVLDNGPVPRLAIAKQVTDRKKLTTAWNEISAAVEKISMSASKMMRFDINVLKPERMKKGGLDIWSYQLGITTSEANLALGLNDKIFFLTTSPNYIAERADELEAKQAVKGAELVIRMAPLREAAEKWLTLLVENGEDFMSKRDWNKLIKNKTKIEALLNATKQMEKLDIYTRKVDGEIRNTIHFNTNK